MTPEYWFLFQNEKILISNNHSNPLLTTDNVQEIKNNLVHQHSLGPFNGFTTLCAELPAELPLPSQIIAISLRKGLEVIGSAWYPIVIKAISILNWDKNHQFCGQCGNKTTHKPGTFERSCATCNQTFYPRISPSVIVLIKRDKEILMARSPHFTPGVYGLIAGFVEPGETAEEAAHREVLEEVGIKIKNLRYFGSQPWPFPDSLIIAFTAEYESGEIVIDKNEIEAAGWYTADNLPGLPSLKFSMGYKLIEHYIEKNK